MTTGIVQEVKTRQVKTKYGLKPVYDLVINNTKYGWGFKDPTTLGISVGTEVSFVDVPPDKYGPKLDPAAVTVLGQGKSPPPFRVERQRHHRHRPRIGTGESSRSPSHRGSLLSSGKTP